MRSDQVNQNTLAKKLNLSTATVSRSLRNHPDISPETRDRVIQEASRLGYRVRGSDNSGLKNSLLLGVFVAESTSTYANPLERMYMTGMSQVAHENNALLFTHYMTGLGDERLTDPQHQPPALRTGMIAGLALIHGYKPEVVAQVSSHLPCITLTHHVPLAAADHIDSDHDDGMLALTEHLTSLGHRQIGFIRCSTAMFSFSRLSSFIKALYRLGLSWDPSREVRPKIENEISDEKSVIDRVVAQMQKGITAWVCDSDQHGYMIYRHLVERGIKIPQKVSIVGYDGLTPFENCPQLTTVKVPFIDMGRVAISQLLARIQEPKMLPRQILLRCEFVLGATSGPVPSA